MSEQPWQVSGELSLGWMNFLKEHAPEYLEGWDQWMMATRERKELDAKAAEFVIIAIDAAIHWPSPMIDSHIHKAFNVGATARELTEVMVTAGMLMGPHTLNHGLGALDKAIRERQELGLPTPMTRADV